MKNARFVSPALFLIILICFLLPFASFSCGGSKIMSFSGCTLVTGTNVDYGFGNVEKIKPDLNAVLLWLTVFAGFIISFFSNTIIKLFKLLFSGLSFLLIVVLLFRLSSDIKESGTIIVATLEYGIYLTLLFILITIVWSLIDLFIKKEKVVVSSTSFCPNCKATINPNDLFCQECGFNLKGGS